MLGSITFVSTTEITIKESKVRVTVANREVVVIVEVEYF